MKTYIFEQQYPGLFLRNGIDLTELLHRANLPLDCFSREDIRLTREEYYRILTVLDAMLSQEDMIRIVSEGHIEHISPPIFAAFCSRDGIEFIHRFAKYKQLIGPERLIIVEQSGTVTISILPDGGTAPLPTLFATLTFLFITSALRKATGKEIVPMRVVSERIHPSDLLGNFLGCIFEKGGYEEIVFRKEDLNLPFKTHNESMWSYIEPELQRRLCESDVDETVVAQVRSSLVELLPMGHFSVEDVARKLLMSKRTLQRKLTEEGSSYQLILNNTRLLLAQNYIRNERRSTEEIAFLLGYSDVITFQRAFAAWTGISVSAYRDDKQQ